MERFEGDSVAEDNAYQAQLDRMQRLEEALRSIRDGQVMCTKEIWTHADTVVAYQTIARKALA